MKALWISVLVVCTGASSVAAKERIVGGEAVTVSEYPSIVQVEFLSQISAIWSHNCGGSILNSRYVLSGAQCFSGWNSEAPFRRIRAGATYRHVGGLIVFVEAALNHPSYGANGIDGDISIVRLGSPLVFAPDVQQATIAAQGSFIPDNYAVVFAGWGRIFDGGPHSDVLRAVQVYTVNNDVCAKLYSTLTFPLNVTRNMICAGVYNIGGRDACHDDSGGPMYLGHIVIGVISGGYGCANGSWPGISTAVASYTNWIVEVAQYYNPSELQIRAGANNRNTGGLIHNVQIVIPSPTFDVSNITTWRDDVAVVRLTSYFIYSNIIDRATIAAPGSVIPAGITLNQLGWENTNSSALSDVSIVTIDLSNCGLTSNNTESLCSASSDLLDNASPGSPLLYEGINVGRISGVNFVNNSTTSLVSANIAAYTAWIVSVVV